MPPGTVQPSTQASASQIVLGLQTIASRQVDVTKAPSIISVGRIEGGVRNNVIPDQVAIAGTEDDPLYQSERYAALLSYDIPTNGIAGCFTADLHQVTGLQQAIIGLGNAEYQLIPDRFQVERRSRHACLGGVYGMKGAIRHLALDGAGRKVEFYFYLRRNLAELERKITHITFALGCTPMVNLYQKRADPIQLDQTQTEYRVVPDQRHPRAAEVYSVDRVVATMRDWRQFTGSLRRMRSISALLTSSSETVISFFEPISESKRPRRTRRAAMS